MDGVEVHVTGAVTRVFRFGTEIFTLQFVRKFAIDPERVWVLLLNTTAPGRAGFPSTRTRTSTPAVEEFDPVPVIAVVVTSAVFKETSIMSVFGAVLICVFKIVVHVPFAGAIVNFVTCTAAFDA